MLVALYRLLHRPGLELFRNELVQPEATARQYHTLLGPESAQAILEVTGRAGVSVPTADVRAHAPRIKVVAAGNDALTPPDVTARIADYYGAEYHLLPGQGHDGLLLGPDWSAAAQLVSTFVGA